MSELLTHPLLLAAGFLEGTWHVALVILGVGFLIFVHELGHFAVAKWANVKVEAFSLGFGPYWEVFRKGETSYRLSAIPLGGYVKMVGELPGEKIEDPRSVSAQSVGVRAAIFSAGVIMNALIGVLIFIVAFGMGVSLIEPEVPAVQPGSEAWKAQVRAGDRILAINGVEPLDFEAVVQELVVGGNEGEHRIVFERDGRRFERALSASPGPSRGLPSVGIVYAPPLTSIATVEPGGPAHEAGIRTGDRIVSVDGIRHRAGQEIQALLQADTLPKRVVVERDGKEAGPFELVPTTKETGQKLLGIQPFSGVVGLVRAGSLAERAGLTPGDELQRGDEAETLDAFATRVRRAERGTFTFSVWRDGVTRELSVDLPDAEAAETFVDSIGPDIDPLQPRIGFVPDWMVPEHPLRAAGVPSGATIVSIGGTEVTTWGEVLEAGRDAGDGPVDIAWRFRDGPVETADGVERATKNEMVLGLAFGAARREVQLPVGQAIVVGFDQSIRVAKSIVKVLGALFTKEGVGQAISGPVGIFQISKAKAEEGFADFLLFLGMLSINLAIINILPLPILDGGHLMFLAIEKIKGRPVSPRMIEVASWVGLLAILTLLGFATFNDVFRR